MATVLDPFGPAPVASVTNSRAAPVAWDGAEEPASKQLGDGINIQVSHPYSHSHPHQLPRTPYLHSI